MGRRDEATCPKGRRHWCRQRLRQGEDFRAGLGRGGPVAGDDRDSARAGQDRCRTLDVALIGHRAVHRNPPRLGLERR